MSIEKRRIEKKQQLPVFGLLIMFFLLIVVGVQLFEQDTAPNSKGENWYVEWTARELPIEASMMATLQVVIMDDRNDWVVNADVKTTIHHASQSKELEFYHLEDGVYETTVVFSSPGVWTGNLTVESGENLLKRPVEIPVY